MPPKVDVYRHCLVSRCPNDSTATPDKVFIRVPQDKCRKERWLKLLKREDLSLNTTSAFVCEDHFELEKDMSNFMKWKLSKGGCRILMNKWVVPHKCLPFSKTESQALPKKEPVMSEDAVEGRDIQLDRQRKAEDMSTKALTTKCCVPHCTSNVLKDKIPFFTVPKNSDDRRKWLDAIGANPNNFPNIAKVCFLHFDKGDYYAFPTRTKLNKGAVPHLDLKEPAARPMAKKVYGVKGKAALSKNSPMDEAVAPILPIEEVIVKEESDDSGADDKVINQEAVGSSTDEAVALEIPVEEVIIKDEPDDNYTDDETIQQNPGESAIDSLAITEDPLPIHIEESMEINETSQEKPFHGTVTITNKVIKPVDTTSPNDSVALSNVLGKYNDSKPKELIRMFPLDHSAPSTTVKPAVIPPARNVYVLRRTPDGKPYLTAPIEKKTVSTNDGKKMMEDFTLADMCNPVLAAKFYTLAFSLARKKSLNFHRFSIENRSLRERCAELTKQVIQLESTIVDFEMQLKSVQPTATAADGTDEGSLKRKADSATRVADSLDAVTIPQKKRFHVLPETQEQDPLEQQPQQPQQPRPQTDRFVPSPKSLQYEGPFRIVELQHFINAIIAMQTRHSVSCSRSVMVVHSEVLQGLKGNWTFVCKFCGHQATVPTERVASQSGRAKGMQARWLAWLASMPKSTWTSVYQVFRQLNVPCYFSLIEGAPRNTLKTIVCKRTFVTDNRPSRMQLTPRSSHVQLTPQLTQSYVDAYRRYVVAD